MPAAQQAGLSGGSSEVCFAGFTAPVWGKSGASVDHAAHSFEVMGGVSAAQGGRDNVPLLGFVFDNNGT